MKNLTACLMATSAMTVLPYAAFAQMTTSTTYEMAPPPTEVTTSSTTTTTTVEQVVTTSSSTECVDCSQYAFNLYLQDTTADEFAGNYLHYMIPDAFATGSSTTTTCKNYVGATCLEGKAAGKTIWPGPEVGKMAPEDCDKFQCITSDTNKDANPTKLGDPITPSSKVNNGYFDFRCMMGACIGKYCSS